MSGAWMRAVFSLRHADFLLFHVKLEMLISGQSLHADGCLHCSWPLRLGASQHDSDRMLAEVILMHAPYGRARALGHRE